MTGESQALGQIAVKRIAVGRLFFLDALRGSAVLAMIAYHLSWDLDHFQVVDIALFSAPWRWFAYVIAGTFLFAVGVSLTLAHAREFRVKAFLLRLGMITAAAAAITGVTWWVFSEEFIFFGILHCIAVSSILGLAFLRLPAWVAAASGVAVLLAPSLVAGPTFDNPWLWWLGLNITTPHAYDWVPLFPWFAWPLFGIAFGRLLASGRLPMGLLTWQPCGRAAALLRWLGRHSLAVYLLHQPILFGLVWGLALAFE